MLKASGFTKLKRCHRGFDNDLQKIFRTNIIGHDMAYGLNYLLSHNQSGFYLGPMVVSKNEAFLLRANQKKS